MEIIKINKNNLYFREIINIFYKWWGQDKESYEEMEKRYLASLDDDKIPNLYALIINETLVGCYEINEKDNILEKSYHPYLANVFVKEEYRGLGYSKYLITDAIDKAKQMGYKKLYLHSNHENLYEKYGFKFLEKVKTKNGDKRIYVIKIKST